MKPIKLIISLLIFCISINIKAQEADKKDKTTLYEGCCGTKPVEYSIGNAKVYMPNVFTPNGDGLNDVFFPHISDEIEAVQSYTIYSAIGDTVLYNRDRFLYSHYQNFAWRGYSYHKNGTIKAERPGGAFKYSMRLIDNTGKVFFIKGEACLIRCGKEAKVLKNNKGCYYSDQAQAAIDGKGKGNGKAEKNKKSKEKDCF